MKQFKINYEYTGYSNEFKSLIVDGKEFIGAELSDEAIELLTAMSYDEYSDKFEYIDGIAKMIGYETTLQAILDLAELGVRITSASNYRRLVTDSYKNKYKGLWR